MTVVKICGLRTIEQALAAATAGADWLGLVFAPSRRRISLGDAAMLVRALRNHRSGERVKVVGLFVNEQPAHINAVTDHCKLDYVQLSGTETTAQAVGINQPIIKALRLDGSPAEAEWITIIENQQPSLRPGSGQGTENHNQHCATAVLGASFAVLPLIDAHVPGSYGGTGALADWERAAAVAQQHPLILAGGLTPDNVAAAISRVRPWGVDVSSGVEINGSKDPARIEAFVGAVRALE